MAIGLARPEYVSRSRGKNACCKSAYNGRSKIVDQKTGQIYNWIKRDGNVFHEILLPEHADQKFNDVSNFSNEVERAETRKDSQLYVEWLLALAKDEDGVDLEFRIETVKEFIKRKGWVKEGLGVQIDIHEPHKGDVNWHAHLLVTTRRFASNGLSLDAKKARDLQPVNINGVVQNVEELQDSLLIRDIQNEQFKARGMSNRVDLPGEIKQEHIGPVRMRSIMNEAVHRNEARKEANIEHLNNGHRVIERVTAHMSVFDRKDIERAVKIVPNSEIRTKLVEDALSSKSLISLYDESGRNTGYYTTTEIRAEEEKLLRLSGYVAHQQNVVAGNSKEKDGIQKIQQLLTNSNTSFSPEQEKALSELLLSKSGLRILRGRAGTGKSHLLGELGNIVRTAGINVIGIAPTHKAKNELASRGYEQNDTVKGMLFKLHNGRFELPKYSLLVVDEAGMIGNDDFKELLRVAASRKCNVILSGDEKQLASVQRGGMFEVFAESYGSSSILNIQRQKDAWGRLVAMAFSEGEVASGISILQEQNKIIEKTTRDESMQTLLADWSKSKEKLTDRLIIAVKNNDVAALNHGARQYLKLEGLLKGEEIAVGGNHYMQGDRILIKETNKELGLVNGDFATLIDVSKERFIVSVENVGDKSDNGTGFDKVNDNSRLVEFNPTEYRGFKHGYATTVFKAQGASIKDVYVFHDGFAGIRNSYVALSRHVKELGLYINNQSTKSLTHLIKQLGHDPEIGSSLSYLSKQDLENREIAKTPKQDKNIVGNLITRAAVFASEKMTALADKYIPTSEYYNYKAPELKREKVEAVLDTVAREMSQEAIGNVIALEEPAVVGGNSYASANILNKVVGVKSSSAMSGTLYANNTRQTAKERFYAKADYVRKQSNHLEQKAKWNSEAERLRSEVKYKSEAIARDLLGEPNKSLSNRTTLRFGGHGRVAVGISGERMGSWYDFARDKGGDMFSLVQDKQGCDFKGAAEYLRRSVGMEAANNSHLQLVNDHRNKDLTQRHIKARAGEERINKAKAEQVEKLYARSKDIGNKSVAFKYLTVSRGIDASIVIGEDIKTTGIYVPTESAGESNGSKVGKYLPALVAFARDSEGRVTGGQQILLNKSSGAKADVAIPKKSFGRIAGSFVDVGEANSGGGAVGNNAVEKEKITIIAEGLETALSAAQGLREHSENKAASIKTLCSLGVSNIKNYEPSPGERIIISADNDGIDSFTNKTIENARIKLEEKGAYVEIVRPSKSGDFNDILKSDGEQAISEAFEPALSKHRAQTLAEYFAKDAIETKLDEHDKSNLAYIERYDLPQGSIVDAYRQNDISGKLALEEVRKGLEMAASHFDSNKEIYKEARGWGYGANEREITKSMIGMDDKQALEHSSGIRDGVLKQYFEDNLNQFKSQKNDKNDLEQLKPIIRAEQKFLKTTYESLKSPIEEQSKENQEYLQAGKLAATTPEILEDVFSLASRLQNTGASMQASMEELQNSSDLKASCKKIGKEVEVHEARLVRRNAERENFRDIDKILTKFEGSLSDRILFNKSVNKLQRFGQAEDLRDGLLAFKDQDIYSLERHTNNICTNNCMDVIGKEFSKVKSGHAVEIEGFKYHNKSDYLAAIVKDDNIMQYVEQSLSRCGDPELKNVLICRSNERGIDQILEEFKGSLSDRKLLQESVNDLQRFGQAEDLRNGLAVFKDKGIDAMENYTNTICTNNIRDSIYQDFRNIRKNEQVGLIIEGRYNDKSDYLATIAKDDNIMKYIEPKSDIGQEMEKQQIMQNQQSKRFDLEM